MSYSDLFIPIKFTTSVQLKPSEIEYNIDEVINAKLKGSLENMCSKHGYIKKNSIKIIRRSMGSMKIQHFNGNFAFDIQCVAEICNPAQGSIIKCQVKAKNYLGLMAEGYYDNIPILQVIVPKISAGIQSEIDIDTVSIGDTVSIEVCGKKFLLYDKFISIIGKVIKNKEQKINNILVEDFDDSKTEDNDNDVIENFNEIYEDNDATNTEVFDDEDEEDEDVEEDEDAEDADDIDDDLEIEDDIEDEPMTP